MKFLTQKDNETTILFEIRIDEDGDLCLLGNGKPILYIDGKEGALIRSKCFDENSLIEGLNYEQIRDNTFVIKEN